MWSDEAMDAVESGVDKRRIGFLFLFSDLSLLFSFWVAGVWYPAYRCGTRAGLVRVCVCVTNLVDLHPEWEWEEEGKKKRAHHKVFCGDVTEVTVWGRLDSSYLISSLFNVSIGHWQLETNRKERKKEKNKIKQIGLWKLKSLSSKVIKVFFFFFFFFWWGGGRVEKLGEVIPKEEVVALFWLGRPRPICV